MPRFPTKSEGLPIGEGKDKVVLSQENNTVLVQNKERGESPKNFGKAQFFMHKILSTLSPNNFPEISYGGEEGIVVEDKTNDDLIRAQDLTQKLKNKETISAEEGKWYRDKSKEIKTHPEFISTIRLIESLGIAQGGAYELGTPNNTIIQGDHIVIIDLFNPIEVHGYPAIHESTFFRTIENKVQNQEITEEVAKRLKRYYQRYRANVEISIKKDKPQT